MTEEQTDELITTLDRIACALEALAISRDEYDEDERKGHGRENSVLVRCLQCIADCQPR